VWPDLQANLTVAGDDTQGRLRVLIAATCTFFEQLNSTCPPVDRQSRPLVEAEVQRQVSDFVLGWLRAHVTVEASQPAAPEVFANMVGMEHSQRIVVSESDTNGDGRRSRIGAPEATMQRCGPAR